MVSPIDHARKRKALLEAELKQIQQFIEMYEAFERAAPGDVEQIGIALIGPVSNEIEGAQKGSPAVENRRKRVSGGPTPKELVDIVERIIREAGRPLTRGDITHMLEARDVDVPAADKARYVGTIMWRNKSKFLNVEGRGYWLRNEAMPLNPAAQEDRERFGRIAARLSFIRDQIKRTGESPIPENDYETMLGEYEELKAQIGD